jgi:membrane-bound metal-dependent hydrolase YbcI (DUF457 family)
MFVLGHLGIGARLAGPWKRGLPFRWVLIGTLFPDMIDKPLYYAMVAATGRVGADIGLISGTRTIAHTAIALALVTAVAWARRSKALAALALGVATHLLLDNVTDRFMEGAHNSAFLALVFPLAGGRFGAVDFQDPAQHLGMLIKPFILVTEAIGAALLGWELWKIRHENEVLVDLKARLSERRRKPRRWRQR